MIDGETQTGAIVSVNLSEAKGTTKQAVPSAMIDSLGVVDDAHRGPWHRQVSLLARESIDGFASVIGRALKNGEFAENLTTQGIDLNSCGLLDRIRTPQVELEVTQLGKKCHGKGCAIYDEVGKCVMPTDGIFCRVIQGGEVRPGDMIELTRKVLKIATITVSDRASRGEYEDLSGPALEEQLRQFFEETRWTVSFEKKIIPDEREAIESTIRTICDSNTDAIFLTGGTGVGPRDVTPEAVRATADKEIAGIMDHVRLKYGSDNPLALLSRSVAAVRGSCLIFALPGSRKAVKEYVTEIEKVLEHLILTVNGVSAH